MVYVYATDISKLLDPLEYPDVVKELPEERKNKIFQCKQRQSRLQSLGAGLLLNSVLQKQGISSDTIRIAGNGKPMADGICFNLSHSGDYVICAVSDSPVGCDIEQIREIPKKIENRAFSPDEITYLKQYSGNEYHRQFFRLWTRKESFLKMQGIGIRVPLSTVEIKDCYSHEYRIPGYQITVCARENEFAELKWENF